jgi:hypothetical protein
VEKCRLAGVVLPDNATNIVVQGYIEVLEGSKVANYDTTDSHNISLSNVIPEMILRVRAIGPICWTEPHRAEAVLARAKRMSRRYLTLALVGVFEGVSLDARRVSPVPGNAFLCSRAELFSFISIFYRIRRLYADDIR